MARDNKISLPSSGGGLIRYFDEYRSKISFKPGHIIVLVVIIIIIEVILHTWGYGFLGIR
ncbi:MAG: preprotein translocase subunit Sec61beta [Nanoarchaeota archaeon]|nr:preprotein translocase subunit Sec61beta [Nanoarchaeota archaeon]MBU4284381.1 preprotein translocase subunit Sec61beta [Nanoarchaeota archaeon]MBU4492906.1 preprotein translocase subunit Sec61beta [Nanoarchaeota archaeon]